MKLTRTASGKKFVKMSKFEWQRIGKKAGWMKRYTKQQGVESGLSLEKPVRFIRQFVWLLKSCNDIMLKIDEKYPEGQPGGPFAQFSPSEQDTASKMASKIKGEWRRVRPILLYNKQIISDPNTKKELRNLAYQLKHNSDFLYWLPPEYNDLINDMETVSSGFFRSLTQEMDNEKRLIYEIFGDQAFD